MRHRTTTRRDLLAAAGLGSVALPMMQATHAAAQTGAFPKRLLLVFSPNGTIHENWVPTGEPTNWQLSRILQPLAPHKNDIIVLDDIKNVAAHNGPGDGHMTGMGCLWTATELLSGTAFKCGGTNPCSGWGGGISVDQYIANQIKPPTKFKTLEFAARPGGATIWTRMIYAGADQPVAPMEDPSAAFDRIFGGLGGDADARAALRLQRKSVLDYVNKRLTALRPQLPSADRAKLDAHVNAVGDVEKRLVTGDAGANCKAPAAPQKLDFRANDSYPKVLQLQTDLLVQAFACDLTRIASLQWSRSVDGTRMGWIGVNEGHHDLSHKGDGDAAAKENLTKINTWYAEQFAYLIQQMKSIPEGNGTMLDNTVVVWGNELGKGNQHTRSRIPFVIAGGGAGTFKTGRFLRYKQDSHSNLLVSLCQYMGVETNTFGNPKYVTGPLSGLTG